MGARVCMVCYPDPLEALRWLGANVMETATADDRDASLMAGARGSRSRL
jgi:hypothetical protein